MARGHGRPVGAASTVSARRGRRSNRQAQRQPDGNPLWTGAGGSRAGLRGDGGAARTERAASSNGSARYFRGRSRAGVLELLFVLFALVIIGRGLSRRIGGIVIDRAPRHRRLFSPQECEGGREVILDRKSTRLNSSHVASSY